MSIQIIEPQLFAGFVYKNNLILYFIVIRNHFKINMITYYKFLYIWFKKENYMLHFKFDAELAQPSLLLKDGSVVVSYKDEKKKNLAIQQALFDKLYSNQASLFIIPDSASPESYLHFLKKNSLDHLCLHIDNTSKLGAEDVKRLRTHTPTGPDISTEQIKKLEEWLDAETSIAFENFDKLHSKLFGNLTRLNLIESYKRAQEQTGGIETNLKTNATHLELTKDEFWKLREIIVEAANLYSPAYRKESLTLSFPTHLIRTLDNSNDIDGLVADLLAFHAELSIVLKQMRQYLVKKRDDMFSACFNKVSNCIQELSLLKEIWLLDMEKNEASMYNLMERYNSIVDVLSGDEFLADSIHTFPLESPQDLFMELESLVDSLRHLKHIDSTKIDRYLSRLNKHNLTDKQYENLQTRIAHVVKKIRNKNILSSSYDDDAFTLQLQFDSLKNIYQELETINHYLVDNRGFAEWKLYKKKQGTVIETLLNELEQFPVQNWIVIFEAWYILQILSRDESFQKSFNGDALSFVSRLNDIVLGKKADFIAHRAERKRDLAKQNLLRTSTELYAELFRKEQPENITWKDLLLSQSKFLSDYFPILIIHDSLAKELGFIKQEIFDCIFMDNALDLKFVDLYHLRTIGKHFHLYDPATIDTIAERNDIVGNLNPSSTKSCKIELPMPFSLESDKEYGTIKRLNFCKKLSTNIIAFNSNLRLFQAKNLSVISFWSGFKNDIFLEQFRDLGIKEIVVDDKENRIIEALLEPGNINVLLYSDGLLNSEKREYYAWQQHLIECLQSAGVHCFDSWTDELIQNGTGVILNVLEEIKLLLMKKENRLVTEHSIAQVSPLVDR